MPSLHLDSPIKYLKGVGPKLALKLEKLNIRSPFDLLYHQPRYFIDYSKPSAIKSLRIGDLAVARGIITNISIKRTPRRFLAIVEFVLKDENSQLKIIYFNQPYLKDIFREGEEGLFFGRVGYDYASKTKSMNSPQYSNRKTPVPIYPETAGVTSKYLSKLINNSLLLVGGIDDYLPSEIVKQARQVELKQAIKYLHQPENISQADVGRRRLIFDDLYLLNLNSQLFRRKLNQREAPQIATPLTKIKKFVSQLPFKLTDDQRKAAWQILSDLSKERPMNRLLNGDVGSGKTVVAAIASLAVINSGHQVVVIVPTEILARQHFETFSELFGKQKIQIALITRGDQIINQQKNDLIIGTQALLFDRIDFNKVGLVVIDEQHRFGVNQRREIQEKGRERNLYPHLLSMTATPIPRTMQLTIYGDLDISIIEQMPKGRIKVETQLMAGRQRETAYELIRREIKKGHQALIICPLIEEQGEAAVDLLSLDRKAVLSEWERLKKEVFPKIETGYIHGKLKPKEKAASMAEFVSGQTKILVSTSMVEVGMDITNLSTIMIENADRFGLAQLHQLRGRVGRSDFPAFCLLLTENQSEKSMKRLKAMEEESSGFKLSQIDLETRGPGDVFGAEQSGYFDLRISRFSDIFLLEQSREAAKETLRLYPELTPSITMRLKRRNQLWHRE